MRAHDNRSAKALVLRFDRVCGEINAFLLVLAIGLAALDATYFVGTRCVDQLQRLPQLTHTAREARLRSPMALWRPLASQR